MGADRLIAEAANDGQGVIPCSPPLRSVWAGKGQPRTKAHSDRSAKAGQSWSRHEVTQIVPASSVLTREPISITVLGGPEACPECHCVPTWDIEGNLACHCRIWSDPDPNRKEPSPDPAIEQQKRNQNYQRDMRRFFKGGRC